MDQDREDLVVLGLAGGDDHAAVAAFIQQTGVSFPVGFDDGVLKNQIAFPPSISPYPRQVVLDRDGRIVYVATEHRESELVAAIDAALAIRP